MMSWPSKSSDAPGLQRAKGTGSSSMSKHSRFHPGEPPQLIPQLRTRRLDGSSPSETPPLIKIGGGCSGIVLIDCDPATVEIAPASGDVTMYETNPAGQQIRKLKNERGVTSHAVCEVETRETGMTLSAQFTDSAGQPSKDLEEQDALESLVSGWNHLRGTSYVSRHQADPALFEDGFMESKTPEERTLRVQITHLEPSLRGRLGRDRHVLDFDISNLGQAIQAAICRKSYYPEDVQASALLALYLPVDPGEEARNHLEHVKVDPLRYQEVWVCVSRRMGHPLKSATPLLTHVQQACPTQPGKPNERAQ